MSDKMEKIPVEWSDGRSKWTASLVKKSVVKNGTVTVGEKVVLAWGKSKRTFNAKVIDVGIGVRSAEIPRQDPSNDEAFAFEL